MRKPIELEEIRANEFMDIIGADFQKRISSKGGVFKLWYIGDGLALIEREGHRDQVLVLGPSVILIPKGDTSPGDWTGDEPEATTAPSGGANDATATTAKVSDMRGTQEEAVAPSATLRSPPPPKPKASPKPRRAKHRSK